VGNEDNRTAIYNRGSGIVISSGSDNASLYFRYTIQATNTSGENDDDGISIVANALNSDSITISDAAGNIATDLTHSAVDHNSSYKVDTIPPAVTTFEMDDIEIKTGEIATVTLEFSEPICAVSSECAIVFTAGAIDNASGILPTMSSSQDNDNKTNWTGTFTPYELTEVDINFRCPLITPTSPVIEALRLKLQSMFLTPSRLLPLSISLIQLSDSMRPRR